MTSPESALNGFLFFISNPNVEACATLRLLMLTLLMWTVGMFQVSTSKQHCVHLHSFYLKSLQFDWLDCYFLVVCFAKFLALHIHSLHHRFFLHMLSFLTKTHSSTLLSGSYHSIMEYVCGITMMFQLVCLSPNFTRSQQTALCLLTSSYRKQWGCAQNKYTKQKHRHKTQGDTHTHRVHIQAI